MNAKKVGESRIISESTPVIIEKNLLERYIDIARSWGYVGEITNLVMIDSVLTFMHNGCKSMCPAECENIHLLRVKVASRMEEVVSLM